MKNLDGQRYELSAYVVMDDHVHALLAPLAPFELHQILHSWKSFTAREMQREHKRFAQYFDRIVRDDKEFRQKLDYIVGNPWNDGPTMTSTCGYGRGNSDRFLECGDSKGS